MLGQHRHVIMSCWCLALDGYAFQTNYTAYLIDGYCFSLVRAGSVAPDGSDVITQPDHHTLHCLRDVQQCRDSYFLAVNRAANGSTKNDYGIKFLLDDVSHQRVLTLLDSFPYGHSRDHEGFRVRASGVHSGDGILRDAVFEVCDNSDGCDGVCRTEFGGHCDTPSDLDVVLQPGALLALHAGCMLLSWGCLLPLGVVWARNSRTSDKMLGGHPIWFAGHRILQSVGWLVQLVGFAAIFVFKRGSHFRVRHEIIGLIVVCLGTTQPLNAQLRHLKCVGHFFADGSKTGRRRIWELSHKGVGYAAVTLGALNVVAGIFHAKQMRFGGGLTTLAVAFATICLGSIVALGVVFEVRRKIKNMSLQI